MVMKSQVNMIPSKDTNKSPVSDPKEMEIFELSSNSELSP